MTKFHSAKTWQDNIILAWVPSHIGLTGNEQADQLAKTGLALPAVTEIAQQHTYTRRDCQKIAAEIIDKKWQAEYDLKTCGLHYKALEPTVNRQSKYNGKHRKYECIVSRLRIGHILVNANLHRFNPAVSNKCTHCDAIEDFNHYITCAMSGIQLRINEPDVLLLLKNTDLTSQLIDNIIQSKRRI